MLVGEQPGDQEDVAGEPFVGPAGRVLDRALEEAGIARERVFVTNVVKHFKWRPSPGGKRRLHERPNRVEIGACIPWVEAELRLVRPEALVALGATAAQALIDPRLSINRDRGRRLESELAPIVIATFHPSAVLRADPGQREAAYRALVDDLAFVRTELGAAATGPGARPGSRR
jgi:DNA polymerase